MAHRGLAPPVTVSSGCGRVSLFRLVGRSVVIFTGEIDVAFRGEQFGALVAAVGTAGAPVHVDCAAVTFFGAEGLRMLDDLVAVAPGRRLAGVVTSHAVDVVGLIYPMDTYVPAR